ncbi:MAG: hypothetical protein C0467_23005 [Planctomycetaceae bacterium]|nr:hypothetical protein [Planctomycetaceae bacterium]
MCASLARNPTSIASFTLTRRMRLWYTAFDMPLRMSLPRKTCDDPGLSHFPARLLRKFSRRYIFLTDRGEFCHHIWQPRPLAASVQESPMTVATHPTPEALAAFARGDLPAAELAAVAEHIGACAACCAILSRVPDDTLAGLAREAGGGTDKSPAAEIPRAGAAPTVGSDGGNAPEPAPEVDDGIPAPLADHPRYKVLRELGAGGMGVVYKAEHRIMGRLVALKVMAPHLTAKPGAVERFRKEVRAAAQLGHPNIVTAHDADEAGGLHFLVMEYVEGTSLDRLVARKGPVTVQLACSFIRQAALGLQNAHEKGMVHRDIKPQNMMVTRKAQVKVMDFGLARFVHTDDEEEAAAATRPGGRLPFGAGRPVADPLTNPNLLMGTPDYLSPEQAKNSHNVDSRSDLYSLGCTLFFLLTGKPPFSHASSLIDKLLAHTEEAPPSIRDLRADVPEGLAAVLDKLLAKKPDDRFDTAAEVAIAVQPFLRNNADTEAKTFEVVEGTTAPASGVGIQSAVPGLTPAQFDVADTEPTARERTVLENDRPRKKKKKSNKAQPWYSHPAAKIGAVASVLMVVALVIAASGNGKKKETPAPDNTPVANNTPIRPLPGDGKGLFPGGKELTSPPFPFLPPKKDPPFLGKGKDILPILFVVPSDGLYGPDYGPVVDRIRQLGVDVVTASGQGGHATFVRGQGEPLRSVPVNLTIADAAADPSRYSAIIFCGYNVDEYAPPPKRDEKGPPKKKEDYITLKATRDLIEKMREAKRPIAAICVGERVLIAHGVLRGKSAARSKAMEQNFPGMAQDPGVTWKDEGVVVDGKVITARGPDDVVPFAEAVVKAARSE